MSDLQEISSEIRSLTSSSHEENIISEDGRTEESVNPRETEESRKEKVEINESRGEKRSKEDQLNQQPSFKRMRFEAISEEKSINGFSRMRWQDMPKIKT